MTTNKPIHNIDGSVITPAQARRALREYHLQLQRANQARWLAEKVREESTRRKEAANRTAPIEDDK